MSTGGGHTSLQKSLAAFGVPTVTKRSFIAAEKRIRAWPTLLEESMKSAGQEEREKAIARNCNCYFEGDPAITVILLCTLNLLYI